MSRNRPTENPAEGRSRQANGVKHGRASRLGLRASELRYRRLFETAKDGIFILDAGSGRITDVNPYLEDMLGYTHDELLGKELWEIGPAGDIGASQAAMRDLKDHGYVRYEDLPLETKQKQPVQVEFVCNVYPVDGVKVIQCNVRDISTRRQAEDGARRLRDDLVAKVARLEQRDRELSRVAQMNDRLHACATQGEAYQLLARMAEDLFPGRSGFLAMLHERGHRVETVARWGETSAQEPEFVRGDCWAMRLGQSHEVGGPRDALACPHFRGQAARNLLCVPLAVQGEPLGVLSLFGAEDGGAGTPAEREIALALAEGVKLCLTNLRLQEQLREKATQDALTGLFNRRYLDESLAREMHRALRRRSPLCVAMLDLDHFKRFNDTHGHEAGDTLLRELGKLLRENLRRSDISCRYGGEEFVLVFPDSSLTDTRLRVEQIRELVKQLDVRRGDQPIGPVTVSAGVAQADPYGTSPGALLRAVDGALYAAKHAGRDCVVVHEAAS